MQSFLLLTLTFILIPAQTNSLYYLTSLWVYFSETGVCPSFVSMQLSSSLYIIKNITQKTETFLFCNWPSLYFELALAISLHDNINHISCWDLQIYSCLFKGLLFKPCETVIMMKMSQSWPKVPPCLTSHIVKCQPLPWRGFMKCHST